MLRMQIAAHLLAVTASEKSILQRLNGNGLAKAIKNSYPPVHAWGDDNVVPISSVRVVMDV